jgi:hypothetical protein
MTTAGKRKSQKRKQSRSAAASGQRSARKPRAVGAALLKASRDAMRKQNLRKNPPETYLPRPSNGTALSPALDVVGLLNRRTKALLELPVRMARCHSPVGLWSEQARFMQEAFADCQTVAQHWMTSALRPFQRPRPRSRDHD